MAAASHLNFLHPERKTSFGTVKPLPLAMHVTRPKSAKGRTRSSVNYSHGVEAYSYPAAPSFPQPLLAPGEDVVSNHRGSSSQQLYQPAPDFAAEVPDLFQPKPLRASSSLNKYRVLPSISRKELRKNAVEVMPDQALHQQANTPREEEGQGLKDLLPVRGKASTPLMAKPKGGGGEHAHTLPPPPPPPPPPETKPSIDTREGIGTWDWEEPSEEEPRLLLAIRSPSGQRLECHFRPTDSLETVLAAVERQNLAAYRRCSIETVEVPRRTFSDLSKSLQECAIPHKSVLCILQEDPEAPP